MELLALTHHTGLRLAEVGYLLIALAGVVLVLSGMQRPLIRGANMLAGLGLLAGAVLLIIAAHWGQYG